VVDFSEEFSTRLPAVNQAISEMPGSLEQYVPGLTKERLKRFFNRFAVLVGRIEKRGAKHPQYLAAQGQPLQQLLISLLDTAVSHMSSGAATFAQNSLPQLAEIQDALEKAVGTDATEIKNLSSSVAADLSNAVAASDELLRKVAENADGAKAGAQQVSVTATTLKETAERASTDAERIAEIRRALDLLMSPDGRNKTSLENLARRARERITEVDSIRQQAATALSDASSAASEAKINLGTAIEILQHLRQLRTEAEEVLNLSSQAGLAASYKHESKVLETRSWIFTGILYSAAIAALLIAAFWVLPEIQTAVNTAKAGTSFWQAISLTLLRASVLAPLVYLMYFTTKRVSALETLRMDYAEKAAASLAYSGYRDQMTSDDDLLKQLKGSLLIKFAEHPERLLRPGSTSTSAKVKTAGFEAETSVNTTAPAGSVKEEDAA